MANATASTVHPHAAHAVRAANHFDIWGPFAARRYCERHGVPLTLLRLARQLRAAGN